MAESTAPLGNGRGGYSFTLHPPGAIAMYRLQFTLSNRQTVAIIGPCRAVVLATFKRRKADFRAMSKRRPLRRISRAAA